ncbi:MAG: PAS domain S-box protein [Chloroflexi bacterium]|nr:PAS domain S-box protein [Chloroflexota bacterium]
MLTNDETRKQLIRSREQNALLIEANRQLRDSEEKFKTIFENANDHIVYISTDGTVIDVNDKVEDLFGYKREEVVGKKFFEFGALSAEDWQRCIELSKELLEGKTAETQVLELQAKHKNGTKVFIEVNPRLVSGNGEIKGILAITRDITARKREQELLRRHKDDLERLVSESTSSLEDANIALRVMLEKSEEVKTELEDKVLSNMKEFVLPYLEKLKKASLNQVQHAYLDELETNLHEIALSFPHGASMKFLKLTPTEITVANLIKQGKSAKEIASQLGISSRTVDTHRYNIRTKLGISNKKVNLRTYLLSIE